MDRKALLERVEGKFNVPKEKASFGTLLSQVIGYQGPSVLEEVCNQFATLWQNRRFMLQKEYCPLSVVFGVEGQGKTELCKQLVIHLPQIINQHKHFNSLIKGSACFYLSFGQKTTWGINEVDNNENIKKVIWWRFLDMFDIEYSTDNWEPMDLFQFLHFFRKVTAKVNKCGMKETAICLLLDEIANVDLEPRKKILEYLPSIQQNHLCHNKATFFLITSLEAKYVADNLIVELNRPLSSISLPIIEDNNKKNVAKCIYDKILLCWNEYLTEKAMKDIRGSGSLLHLILFLVYHVSDHFRSLEVVLKKMIELFVPEQFVKFGFPEESIPIAIALNNNVGECKNNLENPLKFMHLISNNLCCSFLAGDQADYAHKLFFYKRMIDNNDSEDEREPILQVIRDRAGVNRIYNILPYISLPYLFKYWNWMHKRSDFFQNDHAFKNDLLPEYENCSATPEEWTKLFFGSVPNLLMSKTPQKAFATLIPVILFLRMIAYSASRRVRWVSLNDLLPGLIFRPWDDKNEVPRIDNINLADRTACYSYAAGDDPNRGLEDLVLYFAKKEFFRFQNGNVDSKLIEFAGPFVFHFNSPKRLLLWSVKFQERMQIPLSTIANDIMNEIDAINQPRKSFYSVIAVPQKRDEINIEEIPRGTIVLPYETLDVILRPFGACSFLLSLLSE